MKLKIKTLSKKTLEVDCDEKITIEELKKQLSEKHGQGPAENIHLILKGKILPATRTVADLGLDAKKFIVLYKKPSRKKGVPGGPARTTATAPASSSQSSGTSPATTTPSASTATTTPTTPTPAPSAATTENKSTTTPTSSSNSDSKASATVSSASSDLVLGEKYNETVVGLMQMTGKSHEHVVMALRASFNNPNRAADLLFSGASMQSLAQMAAQMGGGGSSSGGSSGASGGASEGSSSGGGSGGGAVSPQLAQMLQGLQNSPQAGQLRQMFQQNPQAAVQFLQTIARDNPQLMQLIGQNREAFLQAIMGGGGGGGSSAAGPTGGSGGGPPGTMTVSLTLEEKEGLDNLVNMLGYSRDQVIRAFLICDRNIEYTANYLMNNESRQGMEGVEFTDGSNAGGGGSGETEEKKDEESKKPE